MSLLRVASVAGALWALVGGASGAPGKAKPSPAPAILVGAGDIATCESIAGAEATAKLLDAIPGTVFTFGDNAQSGGTTREFADCYGATWGRHKARTRPAVGNHDYYTASAGPYFTYFGAAAGEPAKGYYSYDLGDWHVVVLNSACNRVGCERGSAQEQWLRADLAAHKGPCSLAYWHRPLFSSGHHGGDERVAPLWQALDDAGVELAIAGHDHDYERFAPQDAAGRLDRAHGIRQFVVGTGGGKPRTFGRIRPNSEARATGVLGVLKLALRPRSYEWRFIAVAGQTFTDSGTEACH